MDDLKGHLRDIAEMRAMMERNSKFLSLSGLSGLSAGLCALAGAVAAWVYLGRSFDYIRTPFAHTREEMYSFLILDALLVMGSAIGLALLFSLRMARKRKLPVWNASGKHLLINLAIPLVVGGAFCLILLGQGAIAFIPASMLLFYGLALLNASKFTLPEIRYLAFTELILGLACAVWIGHGLWFWALGFGIAHIVYGAVMYFKYER
jgi:predicted lysophospholipase L1 biosynthesis ABC-type transport system permease subunit